ncbi:LHFPL tetraspan subfamily member 6 protein [Schistosoma japonicum]|nr:LHFPL tetraspan subfamily member 6 protein [Schistosoma japonicum]
MNYVWLIWCILTWIAALLCTTGCLLPYWLDGKIYPNQDTTYADLSSTLNLFRRCVYPVYTGLVTDILTDDPEKIAIFLNQPQNQKINLKQTFIESSLIHIQTNCGYYQFFDIPHVAWRFSLILLVISCCILFFLAFILSFTGCYLNFLWQLNVHRIYQLGLMLSGLIILLCCILFPIGWSNNDEIVQICGERRSRFDLGHCQLGWAYVVTIISGLLSIFCSVFPNLFFPKILLEVKHHNRSQYTIASSQQQITNDLLPHILSPDMPSVTPTIGSTAGPPSVETASTNLHISDPRIHRVGFETPWLNNWGCLNTPIKPHQSLHGPPMVLIHPDYNLSPYVGGGGYYNTENQLGHSQGSLDDSSSVGTDKKSFVNNPMKSHVSENTLQNIVNDKSNN